MPTFFLEGLPETGPYRWDRIAWPESLQPTTRQAAIEVAEALLPRVHELPRVHPEWGRLSQVCVHEQGRIANRRIWGRHLPVA